MATNRTGQVIQPLRNAVLLQDGGGMTDGHLLGCFIDHRDEAAVAALVKRHSPMVWGVCRRLLPHHDAEDAFQATFLVLVRKAGSILPREMVANWVTARPITSRRALPKNKRRRPADLRISRLTPLLFCCVAAYPALPSGCGDSRPRRSSHRSGSHSTSCSAAGFSPNANSAGNASRR
jgi:Sigma-70 region 2